MENCRVLEIHDRIFYCNHPANDNVGMCKYPWSGGNPDCRLRDSLCESCGVEMKSHKDSDNCLSCGIETAMRKAEN